MGWLGGLLDRMLLLAGVIAGGCVPGFIVQYQQRLGGRLDQVLRDLAPFQEIANRMHGGSLDALIRHHLASTDATFYAEGAAIRAMAETAEGLRAAAQALNTDLWHQIAFLLREGDPELVRATWSSFTPVFSLTPDSITLALALGLSLWLLFVLVWYSGMAGVRRLRGDW
jgi:hypothetical protein